MKYYVTHKNKNGFMKIVDRIKSRPKEMYESYKCFPTKILIINKDSEMFKSGQMIVVFEGEEVDPTMRLLGFSFDLMFDDYERRIREVENYGKFQCIVFNDEEIDINKEQFVETNF